MELDKIRNLSDAELGVEGNKAAEQLFRLRFNLKLGQTEGVKKVRILKKDIARMKTIARERELSLHGAEHKAESSAPAAKKSAARKAPKKAGSKTGAKKTAAKKAPTSKAEAKKAAKKKTGTKKGAR